MLQLIIHMSLTILLSFVQMQMSEPNQRNIL